MTQHLGVTTKYLLITAALIGLIACDSTDHVIKMFNDQVGERVGFKIEPLNNASKPSATIGKKIDPDNKPDHRQVNAAFIHELFKVVLRRAVRSQDEFEKYMNIMDQGGHYEGIYNGIAYSTEYKDKEKGVAPVSAVKAYVDVLTQIRLDQKYDPIKIAKPELANDGALPVQTEAKPPQPTEAERAALSADLEREALTLSLFTLKRRLTEETLKVIELKREYKEKFATWYGRFSVYMNKKGVDFGVPQRNRPDEYYHYKWALEADEDRLRWECINRIHMLMNTYAQ